MIPPRKIRLAMANAGISSYRLDVVMERTRRLNEVERRVKLYAALRDMGYSYNQIGQALGRDHSTIIQMVRKYGQV